MAEIIPFKGTRYNIEKIDISKVVAPPYDVISSEEEDALYNSDPHNIIRILLGRAIPGDNEKENKYTRAALFLKEWLKNSILKKDEEDSVYVYLQEFSIAGQPKKRLGFIALLRLEEFGSRTSSVYPHENTHDAPKIDRTRLIRSIEANLGPIFALFADEDKSVKAILADQINHPPMIDILDFQGIRNKLWKISDRAAVDDIILLMGDKKLFIADGHHRYEAGLAFSKTKQDKKYGYILTYFTDLYDDGIVILPVHRLVSGIDEEVVFRLGQELDKDFAVTKLASKGDAESFLSAQAPSERRFVIYSRHGFTGLSRKDRDSFNVTVVHDLIIESIRKKMGQAREKISIDYTKDLSYAISKVDEGRYPISIILNSANVSQIRDIAFSGRRMPQKSTYFYPKVLTGLVINVF